MIWSSNTLHKESFMASGTKVTAELAVGFICNKFYFLQASVSLGLRFAIFQFDTVDLTSMTLRGIEKDIHST